ncbi:hypothetical protein WJX73_005698 [Symbiochloris irregularis]|uniref:EF-hand domain-containing protein n=1 Tax=Symbiochloris irregularis TaxID=706552 RepID=A0AAW1NT30_9CHLO
MGFRRLGQRFEDSGAFKRVSRSSFRKADRDNSGTIDVKELHIALLLLYDKLNSSLPVHMPVPDKAVVDDLMRTHDVNANGELSFEEFHRLAKAQLGVRTKTWHQSLWFKVLKRWSLKAVLWPVTGHHIKKGLVALDIPLVSGVPASVLAYAAEASYRAARSLV